MTNEINESVRQYWDDHAQRDPLWAILSDEARKDRRWDLSAFMETGEREISLLLHEIRSLGISVRSDAALDFGCGVGRLTQALSRRFDRVVGLDISPRMVNLARAINKAGAGVEYVATDSLRFEGEFDLAYSSLVLQHVPPELAAQHIRALVRSIRPGGLLVFQLPAVRAEEASGPRPMPDAAYAATIRPVSSIAAQLQPGAGYTFLLQIHNDSPHAWRATEFGHVRVGNHWLAPDGSMIVQDDGRAELPADMAPGAVHTVRLQVIAPSSPGVYGLEVDAVHEGITWFGDRGSSPLRVEVRVGDASMTPSAVAGRTSRPDGRSAPVRDYSDIHLDEILPAADADRPVPPDLPMFGIPMPVVFEIVASAGGVVLHAVPDDHAKPEWTGFKYFVKHR